MEIVRSRLINPRNNNILVGSRTNLLISTLVFLTINAYSQENVHVVWMRHYQGSDSIYAEPKDMVIDESGNAYVAIVGYNSKTYFDYIIVKYDTQGEQKWITQYSGKEKSNDLIKALAVDMNGNVYVTGNSEVSGIPGESFCTTLKYNSAGIQQWIISEQDLDKPFHAPIAIAIDDSNNIYIADQNFNVVKYNENGIRIWMSRYSGHLLTNAKSYAYSMCLDDFNNIYVTGVITSPANISDSSNCLTIKYDNQGMMQWEVSYDGIDKDYDMGKVVKVDNQGNVYVAGETTENDGNANYLLIKYTGSGKQTWSCCYDYADEHLSDMLIDQANFIIITGTSGDEYTTVKYDSSGNQQWVSRYRGPENGNISGYFPDAATSIAVDKFNNIYVTGSSYGLQGTSDYATVKYDQKGEQQWVTRYENPLAEQGAIAIEVNAFGDVYITGANKFTNNQGLVTTTIKYTQSEDTQATPFISREMVGVLMLAQNYPNPFNSATTIQFYLPKGGPISLEVYNLLGKRVDTIFYGTMGSGEHTVQWRPVDIASGIYIYQLKTDTFIETNKMLYFK